MDTSREVRDYSFSHATEHTSHSKAVLDLGRNLVRELELDGSTDTLGRWMAHYVAELMERVNEAAPDDHDEKLQACCEAILRLWRHRHELPKGKRPFGDLEPILRAVESLDPRGDTPRYFSSIRKQLSKIDEGDDSSAWLGRIEALERAAKEVIRYCLQRAAESAVDRTARWVKLAEQADVDHGVEQIVARLVWDEEEINIAQELLVERIELLEGMLETAEGLISQLRGELEQLEVQ